MNQQAFIVRTADVAAPTTHRKASVVKLRPRNEKMDALVDHIHTSGKFTFDASRLRIVEAMKKAKACRTTRFATRSFAPCAQFD